MGLRGRLMLGFVLAALLPMAVVGLWARSVLTDLARAEHDRRVASTVVAARDRIEQHTRSDARALSQACERDVALRELVSRTAAAEAGAPSADAWKRGIAALRSALGLDALEVRAVRGPGLRRGAVVAADPAPLRHDDPDPALVRAALGAPGPFVAPAGPDGQGHVLVSACRTSGEGGTELVVLGVRTLDGGYVRTLLGDVTPVRLQREPTEAVPPGQRRVFTFSDAEGEPAVQVVADPGGDPLAAQLAHLDRGFLLAGALAVFLALLGGGALALATTRPLRELERAARRVGAGDLESTVGGHHTGEVGDALDAFNRMTRELKRTRAKLLRAERIAAWRDIARRIAHEVKNPLSPIQMSIETMRKTYAKRHPDFDEIFEESTIAILEEVERLKRIVSEFSQFARMPRPRAEPLDVREVAERVVGLQRDGGVRLRLEARPVPKVRADREQLTQVLSNLVLNGVEAARARHGERGGEVRVRIGPATDGTGVRIEVADNGAGVADAARDRIFDPYYTTKEGGTGLGLAIVHRIVLDHGGEIDVQECDGGGACFVVHLRPEGPPPEAEASTTDAAVPLTMRK
ncbi:MAG: sensor histidine kinase [Myxococcota bacterium]